MKYIASQANKRNLFLLPGTQASCILSRETISCSSSFDSFILAAIQELWTPKCLYSQNKNTYSSLHSHALSSHNASLVKKSFPVFRSKLAGPEQRAGALSWKGNAGSQVRKTQQLSALLTIYEWEGKGKSLCLSSGVFMTPERPVTNPKMHLGWSPGKPTKKTPQILLELLSTVLSITILSVL